jgi:putative ABC transport system permease protein
VAQWLRDNEVVDNDNRVLVGLAFAFLALCLINTVGLLLAKFLNGAAVTGIRRALGASRRQIFGQLLIEVGVVSVLGALLGLALAALGLVAVHHLYAAANLGERGGYQELTHFDVVGVVWAVILAVAATLAAGFYPAWRIGRLSPATYLKSQ